MEGRDALIDSGIVGILTRLLEHQALPMSTLRQICWLTSNLCKGLPPASVEEIGRLADFYDGMLRIEDDRSLSDILWAVAHFISDDPQGVRTDLVMKKVNLEIVVMHMHSPNPCVRAPAIKIIGNICSGPPEHVDAAIACGCLKAFAEILSTPGIPLEVTQEACWAISNITAGTGPQIQKVIDEGLIVPLSEIAGSSPEHKVLFPPQNVYDRWSSRPYGRSATPSPPPTPIRYG